MVESCRRQFWIVKALVILTVIVFLLPMVLLREIKRQAAENEMLIRDFKAFAEINRSHMNMNSQYISTALGYIDQDIKDTAEVKAQIQNIELKLDEAIKRLE